MASRFKPSRRQILTGAALGGAVLAAPWLRPGDQGGTHNAYFARLQMALKEAGLYRPTLVLDSERLYNNTQRLIEHIHSDFAYRIVGKSLPSLPLINTVRKQTRTDRVMVFHQPFLNHLAEKMPDSNLLLGKPMPTNAAKRFYAFHTNTDFDPSRQLQWLIDTPQRLKEYSQLAAALGQNMQINLELDVGLHRGGFRDAEEVALAIMSLREDPYLEFTGFMGYEAHISKMPGIVGGPEQAMKNAMAFYTQCREAAQRVLGESYRPEQLTFNAGGSSTYQMYSKQMYNNSAPCNELAVGSALVKPSDFDVSTLVDHIPAAFIATPVLKTLDAVEVPGLENVAGLMSLLNPNKSRSFFTYGGYWKANPESPPGLTTNSLYGRSTNQEMLNGSDSVKLAVDDFVFLRPTQSEAVFLQFGDIAVFDGLHITEHWPVFQQGA
ncbi:DSD1 family PLP-dependent enzyme [Litorivivens sp.]|uniref:DSD1 family PLP-dependent enzyme n=1 Tax=Litorivivens sp. TaxID=2020868 RepID=UPI00356712D1